MQVSSLQVTDRTALIQQRQAELGQSFQAMIAGLAEGGAGSDYVGKLQENKTRFLELVTQAEQKTGDAKSQLLQLNREDRAVLQKVHGLADEITDDMISDMSKEGAANLLRMRGDGLDDNKDAFTEVGLAKLFQFPNSNTPDDVVAAWEKATVGMTAMEKMMAQTPMMMSVLTANISVNKDGSVNVVEPGDEGFVNPFAQDDFSWVEWGQEYLDYLDDFRTKMSAEQYFQGRSFMSGFVHNLQEEGVA
ncbi:hypothetical protein [Oceanospirillum beijerinckii]|uniref:hypothetical protein n=1 Tax=Oceanospirillum beijerinckii TaxID=64976 RepID=UPI00041F8C75|nr:hypothetical protein [Oceanospirillum beijerinckii]